MSLGIHHITALSSNPQDTYNFYSDILGLRLVKKSVNQDDVQTYHLFFSDNVGSPGMDLTFFPYVGLREGVHGTGQVHEIMLAVPVGSLDFWQERLASFHIKVSDVAENLVGDKYIYFEDWDGQRLQIVETLRINSSAVSKESNEISKSVGIKNFYGASLHVADFVPTQKVIEEICDFRLMLGSPTDDLVLVYENENDTFANLLFLVKDPTSAVSGAGTVHHIAFRAKDEAHQDVMREAAKKLGLSPTQVIDRYYFKSVYFREPGGILFEIATDEPGFAVDESIETLGQNLALPPFLEDNRAFIEANLPTITTTIDLIVPKLKSLFKFVEINNNSDKTIILLHGTGADEYDLLPLFDESVNQKYNLVSLRGNVNENGMLRFFERFEFGEYDVESIKTEAEKLNEFVRVYVEYSGISLENITFLGFSNGAGMTFATACLYPELVKNAVLLHPAKVYAPEGDLDLSNLKALVTYGSQDQSITLQESQQVIDVLKEAGAQVQTFDNDAGHQLTREERDKVFEFLL